MQQIYLFEVQNWAQGLTSNTKLHVVCVWRVSTTYKQCCLHYSSQVAKAAIYILPNKCYLLLYTSCCYTITVWETHYMVLFSITTLYFMWDISYHWTSHPITTTFIIVYCNIYYGLPKLHYLTRNVKINACQWCMYVWANPFSIVLGNQKSIFSMFFNSQYEEILKIDCQI